MEELNEVSELFRKFEKNPSVELKLDLNTKVPCLNSALSSIVFVLKLSIFYWFISV